MLSDEEREAIERLKDLISKSKVIGDIEINKQVAFKDIEMILNLIEKQSKEIEELKKPKYLLNAKTGEITTINNSEFISKDKIKAKIEELDEKLEYETNGWESEYEYCKEFLQSLLEKE